MPNLIDLLLISEKARGGGGRGRGPGSRGGHFWINAGGHVEYGAKPSGARGGSGGSTTKPQVLRTHGPSAHLRAAVARAKPQRAVSTGHGGGSGKPRVGELRAGYRIKPQTSAGKLASHRRMLSEMDKAIKLGKDPHGNKLSAASLDKLRLLATGLRTEIKPAGKAVAKEAAPVQTQSGHTGVMVAFYIDTFSPDAAVKLQVPGGETWDALHLTLAYLGDSTSMGPDAESKLYQLISQFAAGQQPLEGTVSGIGLFNNTEGGETNAFYASFDSPGLPGFRQGLIELLQSNGLMPVQNHGFTPHITLAYVPKGQPIPNIELPSMPLIFTKVTVKWGDKRTDFSIGLVTKEIKAEIATKEETARPFTAYKDITGKWRWIIRSSSSFKDRDGETVSQKALEVAAEKLNATGNFGILDWWHTPANLGPCDFSAMHGRVLVESGTFVNEAVGERIAVAIANKSFKPGASLMFAHNEPGPAVLPGRVFNDIQIIQRSLLPEEIASNAATTMEIVNLAGNTGQASNKTKEVKRKMDAAKEAKLRELLGPQLVEQFLNGSELAEKSLEMAGLSYKAVAPMDKGAVNAAQMPPAGIDPTKKKLDTKAEGMPLEGSPAEELAETPEEEAGEQEGGYEDSPADNEADALMQSLYSEIDRIVQTRLEAASKDILAALAGVNSTEAATATKAVNDLMVAQTLALKENTNALNAVVAENKSLKERLDALEGKQPPAVRARATQGQGVSVDQLAPKLKELVSSEKQSEDPYIQAAGNFLRGWGPQPQ